MKVCYYNHVGKVSGAERVLFGLLERVGLGYDKSLIAPASAAIVAFCEQQGIAHLPVDELQARMTVNPVRLLGYGWSALRSVRQVRRRMREAAPDLVHANSTRAGMIALLATAGLGIPVIWHIHDQLRRHPITFGIGCMLRCSRRNFFIAVSHSTAKAVRESVGKSASGKLPIAVIHNGVDVQSSRHEEQAEFLREHNLESCPFRVVVIGQITPRKGQAGVLQAFAKFVHSGHGQARLLIVGLPIFNNDHLYYEQLRVAAQDLGISGNVHFLGHRSDISAVLQSAHLLVSNSSSEPFGMVLLEASALGTPILAPSVDGIPELILNGVTGTLFSSGDMEALEKGLEAVYASPAEAARMSLAAQQRTVQRFSQDVFLEKVRNFYELVHGSARDGDWQQAAALESLRGAASSQSVEMEQVHDV